MLKKELQKEIKEAIELYLKGSNNLYFGDFIKAYEAEKGCHIIVIEGQNYGVKRLARDFHFEEQIMKKKMHG